MHFFLDVVNHEGYLTNLNQYKSGDLLTAYRTRVLLQAYAGSLEYKKGTPHLTGFLSKIVGRTDPNNEQLRTTHYVDKEKGVDWALTDYESATAQWPDLRDKTIVAFKTVASKRMPIDGEMEAANGLFNCAEWDFGQMTRDPEYLAKFVPGNCTLSSWLPH